MPDNTTQPLFFHGLASLIGEPNRLYRIYLQPGELIFIWAGSGGEMTALTGKQSAQIEARLQQLDSTPLDQLVGDHKYNFRVNPSAIMEARLEAPSMWHTIVFGLGRKHAGLFRLRVRDRGTYTLEIPTIEEMRLAAQHLPEVLGDGVVNVIWDEHQKKYIRKPSRTSVST